MVLNLNRFIKSRYFLPLVIILIYVLLISLVLLFNKSFYFEYEILAIYGDQKQYYQLAYNLSNLVFEKSQYTIGYSLFYIPFVILKRGIEDWHSIMPLVIFTQSLIITPITLFLILITKSRRYVIYTVIIFLTYLLFLFTSLDPLTKFNLVGLVPLSEPLTSLYLVLSYFIYLKFIKVNRLKKFNLYILILGILISLTILTRQASVILLLPIFLDLLINKEYRKLIYISLLSFIFFIPQFFYNYKVSGGIYFDGYKWWASNEVLRNNELKYKLYGFVDSSIFSIKYFIPNLKILFWRYISFLILPLILLIRYRRKISIVHLVILFSILNLLFHLTYWWSNFSDLIDRFLLPNVYLLLFLFGNTLLNNSIKDKSDIKNLS